MAEPRRVAVTLEQLWHRVPGGTATSAIESLRALRRATDLELLGVAARHSGPPPVAFAPPIPVHELPLPRLALYESWHRLRWPPVERVTGPVDVIHATGMAVPPRTAPLVVTVHDLAFVHEPTHFTRRGLSFFHRALEVAARDADVLVCPSRATLDDALGQGLPASRLRLVPWGIDPRPASDDEVRRVRARYELAGPFVLWVGTIEPRKNLPGLLEAMTHLLDEDGTDADLVLAGPEGWHEDLGPWLARLESRVRLLGFVPPEDLGPLYAAASAFCFPSFREGFGLPVLEAMAQGTPVVASVGTALAELVGEGDDAGGILVDPRDPHALARAMGAVLGEVGLAERLGAAARRRAAAFSWDRTAAGLLDAYRQAAGVASAGEVVGQDGMEGAVGGRRPVAEDGAGPGAVERRRPTRPLRVGANLLWCVPGEVGGSEEYTVRLLRAVADAHVTDVVPVLFVNSRFAECHPDLTGRFETVAAPVSGSSRAARVASESTWLVDALRRRRVDVAHHLGGTVPFVRSSPAVVTIHDLQPLAMPELFHPLKRWYLGFAAPHGCRIARRVVTLSSFVRDDVVARTGVPVDRCSLVPPGFDDVEVLGDAELVAVRRRYGLGDHPFFLYPAIPYAHKGHLDLLHAFARVLAAHPETLLVLSGGPGPLDEEIHGAMGRLGVTASVRRVGRIPWGDLDALYRTAAALVFPSRYEGFGMPALESMARGCPVLAAHVGGLPEVVGDGGVLLAAGVVADWAAAMVAVLEEPRRRDELIAAGRRRAATFDWARSAEALLGVWDAAA